MPADEFSWDDPIRSFAETWRTVVSSPREFFSEERTAPGVPLQPAIGFLLVNLLIGGVGLLLFGWGFGALVLFVVGGLIRVLVAAFLISLIATQVFGGKGNYESTVRVLAYASAMAVFAFIPGVRVLATLYALFLVVVGLERAHRFESTSAVLTLLVSLLCAAAVAFAWRGGPAMHGCHAHHHG